MVHLQTWTATGSPYLFLLVANVLQQMIKQERWIWHLAAPDLPFPVLQYADDTLILLAANCLSLQTLKDVLDRFFAATGLWINFNKSTMVPMHTPPAMVEALKGILGCQLGEFPQMYLGLPLSNEKLHLSVFSPLIAKAERYLGGWQASLLNPMDLEEILQPLPARRTNFPTKYLGLPLTIGRL